MTSSDLIKYRYSRALETYEEALILAKENYWNAVANRLYYSCFYMLNALLIKNKLDFSTHNGVKSEFHRVFVKTGIVSRDSGRTYSRLFNLRQEGDYMDFKRLEKEDVEPFIQEVDVFIAEISKLLNF